MPVLAKVSSNFSDARPGPARLIWQRSVGPAWLRLSEAGLPGDRVLGPGRPPRTIPPAAVRVTVTVASLVYMPPRQLEVATDSDHAR